jgi:CheY-like chemotaxis protein
MSKSLEKVLLVDDDVANNFYNSVILKQHNPDIELESLLNGQELIKYVSDNGSENWPVTVFLDLNMHIVDGPEFLEWYHSNGHQGKLKIIMFSASVLPEDIERCMNYEDVYRYFEKPIDSTKLDEIVSILAKIE